MAVIGTDVNRAGRVLKSGGLVAIPTETVYGLAANAFDPIAVAKIFEAKKRPFFDPLIVHCHSLDYAQTLADRFPEPALRLAEKFWPGPLTLVLEKAPVIPDIVTAGMSTVGIRVPQKQITLDLLQQLDFPLAAPSANPFGYISPTTSNHVNDQLGNRLDYILEGGESEVGVESTIIGWMDGRPTVYRLGGLSIEEIEEHYGEKLRLLTNSEQNPSAPGMLKSHYAPSVKLYFKGDLPDNELSKHNKIGYITFTQMPNDSNPDFVKVLSPRGDLKEAANRLFSAMRELDRLDLDIIIAERFPNVSLGMAINDRLKRASYS